MSQEKIDINQKKTDVVCFKEFESQLSLTKEALLRLLTEATGRPCEVIRRDIDRYYYMC